MSELRIRIKYSIKREDHNDIFCYSTKNLRPTIDSLNSYILCGFRSIVALSAMQIIMHLQLWEEGSIGIG